MTYPKWLKIALFQRLVSQREIAGKPMSEATQRAAIAKLRKLVRTGQSQEKILTEAINGVYRGLESAAKEKTAPKQPEKATKPPVLPGKPKDLNIMNKNLGEMRNILR